MADRDGELSFFQGFYVRIELRIDFHYIYDYQIWQADTSRGVN